MTKKTVPVDINWLNLSFDAIFLFPGNLKSLKETPESQNIDPHDRLHDFYTKSYSAQYMTLAVQSKGGCWIQKHMCMYIAN